MLLFELTDFLSGNKEKVKCSSGKVAYRACDKVLMYISGFLVFLKLNFTLTLTGEVGGRAEILDF